MNLVDSSGWLEYFGGGKNAGIFAQAIESTKELIVSAINIYEVYKKVLTERNENNALEAIGLMQQGRVIDVDISISIQAASINYINKLPMADSIIYATALQNDAVLWTQDIDFKGLPYIKLIKK